MPSKPAGWHIALRHDRRCTPDDRRDETNGPTNFPQGAARFTEIRPHDRLAITSVIDFLPGVIPYESTIVAEFFPSGETVRMVVTLDPMHDEEFTKMQRRASRANSRSSTSGTGREAVTPHQFPLHHTGDWI